MKLYKLKVEGFRRIYDAEFIFGEATFLIGVNNVGKSSVLKAIEYLLSDKKDLMNQNIILFFRTTKTNDFQGKSSLRLNLEMFP